MEKIKPVGLIYGPYMHHLDHLATICSAIDAPLYVTEDEICFAAERYYPNLTIYKSSHLELPHQVTRQYNVVISSLPRPMFDKIFFITEHLYRNKLLPVWCPHGSSDKGSHSFFIEALSDDKIALVYGNKMIDFLKEKKTYDKLYACITLGNYRLRYYNQQKAFYDSLIQEMLTKSFRRKKKVILYAPTWKDNEASTSFFEATPLLIENLPEKYQLIVKPHPNLLLTDNQTVLKLVDKYSSHPNVLFLLDFPPIYPLLNVTDIYIGDMSSIGYDFLFFDRPMFFLNQQNRDPKTDKGLFLYRCGGVIPPEDYANIYNIIEEEIPHDFELFSEKRREVYEYTFGKEEQTSKELKEKILTTCKRFLEEEIHLL